MEKYTIDYEYGVATFMTHQTDPVKALSEFYYAANLCFGIRKSIGETKVTAHEKADLPKYLNAECITHYLKHSGGDEILFNADERDEHDDWVKLKSEWD